MILNEFINKLPERYKTDIEKAACILKAAGCSEVYIFGSLTDKNFNAESDIDIAVKGMPKELFFQIGGRLMIELDHRFDLIEIDNPNSRFAKHIINNGELIRVA